MPNKRRFNKLKTKLLAQGKLNSSNNERVRNAVKYLADKAEIDQEDIDFDYDVEKNGDFEKLEDGDDKSKKGGNAKKRKATKPAADQKAKKQKKEEIEFKKSLSVSKPNEPSVIPKKSKKNKYFLVAHPEVLTSKKGEELLANESIKKKFVIDEEKIKLNSVKKKKVKKTKGDETSNGKATNNDKKKGSKLWVLEQCGDSEDDSSPAESPFYHDQILDISDIDKNFKLKKVKERLPDGSYVEVLKPEYVQGSIEVVEKDQDVEESEELAEENTEETQEEDQDPETSENTTETKSDSTRDSLKEKLTASRFRYLNELLYTQPSGKSFEYFKKDPDAFRAYHDGFQSQAVKWPINPLDQIIKYIKSKPADQVVADFGCGEALLAKSVKNKVHSFDLVAVNDLVTACDMKKVPLAAQACDIAVFCLSLMGTNTVDFLCEAHRVLKSRGVLKIAEVVSRIGNRDQFIRDVESIGFKLVSKRNEGATKDYFYFFDFVKTSDQVRKRPVIKLTPCLYKKR